MGVSGENCQQRQAVWGRKETWGMAGWLGEPEDWIQEHFPLILLNHSVLLPHNPNIHSILDSFPL